MVFSSMIFLWIFLPVTLIVYYLLHLTRNIKLMNVWLLCASIFFYSWGEPRYIALLIVSVCINFLSGLLIWYFRGTRAVNAALLASIAANLLLLGYFKYYDFAAGLMNGIIGRDVLPIRDIVLPIGISFYTFQAMSYVIDLYRGKTEVQKSLYKLALYITFFPQLVAGPIVRYRDIASQIDHREVDLEKFTYGVQRIAIGLGKKVLIANTVAHGVDKIFAADITYLSTPEAWAGIILYALQIYYDFSGYSDMAIGLGKMFGFDFLENFDLPYISKSIQEFWRRWHISLSTWFREYLYIPLGGNRRGKARTCFNLMLVFFCTGLWHGAGLNFICWGMFHGLFLLLERVFLGDLLEKNRFKLLNHIYTLLVILIGWVLFRAETLPQAGEYITALFVPRYAFTDTFTELLGRNCIIAGVFGILLAGVLPKAWLLRASNNAYLRLVYVPLLVGLSIVMLASDAYNPFIYFRF